MFSRSVTSLLIIASLVAAPTTPAAGQSWSGSSQSAPSASFRLRVPLGGEEAGRKQVSLNLGMSTYRAHDTVRRRQVAEAQVVALSFGRKAATASVVGQPVAIKNGRLAMEGGEHRRGVSPWLIAGGIVLAVGIGAVIWWDSHTCSRSEADDDECDLA